MSAEHINQLKNRHQSLETRLHEESTRPHPDDTLLHDLKRQKLALKDEISRLEHA